MLDYADLAEYVDRAKAQDECAFTYLYEKTCLMVYNIACTILQDEEEAKDIVSEVYIRVFRHIASLEDNRSFIRWLIVITQHVCQDHKIKWKNLPEAIHTLPDVEDPNDLIADWQQKETLRTVIQSLIRQLPQAQQRAVYYVYFKQLSVAQTAALEDCSVNTVLSRLYYARNTLRRAILAEEKRTGDKYHLPVATAALSALMALPQVGFTLSPEEAAKILVSVFTALGVQYTGEKAPPIVTIIQEDDDGKRRSVLIKLRPLFIGALALVGLTAAMLLIGLGYTHGRRMQVPEALVQAASVQAAMPPVTDAFLTDTSPATVLPDTTAVPVTTAAPPRVEPTKPQTASVNGITYTYTVENGSATITTAELNEDADTSAMETLLIPAKLDDWPVTAIGAYAFAANETLNSLVLQEPLTEIGIYAFDGCTALTSVQFPGSLKKIADYSFSGCKSLNHLTFPEGLTHIGASAFSSCAALTAINFPDSLTYIGESAFAGNARITRLHLPAKVKIEAGEYASATFCKLYALREITVDPDNQQLCAVDGVLYSKDMQILLAYPNNKPGEVFTLPASVTRIAESAISSCRLTALYFNDQLTTIDCYAINNCTAITSIHIPASVVTIRPDALRAPKLTEITVASDNPEYISIDSVLYAKDMTELIQYPVSRPDTTFSVPDSVTNIFTSALRGAVHLKALYMSDSVKRINAYALSEMPSLTTVRLSDSITHLSDRVLAYNTSITEYTMPKQLKVIDKSALQGCPELTCVKFQGNAISYSWSTIISLENKDCVLAYPRQATGWSQTYWRNHYALVPYDLPSAEETTAPVTAAAPVTTATPVTTAPLVTTAPPVTTTAPVTTSLRPALSRPAPRLPRSTGSPILIPSTTGQPPLRRQSQTSMPTHRQWKI